ncbi:MAG: hypothetical protein KDC10_13265 [Calditrichaeota bacterium]|nr:hypothetical protein [Calditrichota bacterium]
MTAERFLIRGLGAWVLMGCLLMPLRESRAQDAERVSPLRQGAWAIQFGIAPNFTLNSFSGSILSVKRHVSASSALRLGLSGSLESLDGTTEYTYPDTLFNHDTISNATSLGVELQYLHYSDPRNGLSLYWGAGPSLQLSHGKQTTQEYDVERSYLQHRWSLGLLCSLGVEWCPARFVGIHGEYGLAVEYISQSDQYDRQSESELTGRNMETSGWQERSRPVRFGISLYF